MHKHPSICWGARGLLCCLTLSKQALCINRMITYEHTLTR